MQFFVVNYFLMSIVGGLGINLLSDSLGLPPVVSLKSLLTLPGAVDLALPLAALGLESLCWFWICHKLFKHRMADRHEPPYNRVFNELLYISWPAEIMGLALMATNLVILFGSAIALAWFSKLNLIDLDDIPDALGTALVVIIALICIVLVLLQTLLPILVYNTLIGRVLFKLPQRRAIILASVIWVVSGLPFLPYSLYSHYILPTQLADREKLALEDLRSVLYVERYYYETHHAVLEVSALKHYTEEMLPDADTRKTFGGRFFPALERVSGDSADGYKFSVATTGYLSLLHATPISYGGQTVDSMFCLVAGTGFSVWVENRHGERASLGGKKLVSFEPDI